MKFCLWDIETAPQEGFYWDARTDYITHEFQEQCTTVLCAAWKYLDRHNVHSARVDAAKPRDDRALVEKLHKHLMRCGEENIIIVHQNGDKFDLPKIKARAIYYGLKPLPELITVDTLKEARKIGFDYKRLDYLDKHLHGIGKVETRGWLMWRDVVSRYSTQQKRRKALREMVHYCKGDIHALERVFDTLRPHMVCFPNMNHWTGTVDNCPQCGSPQVIYRSKPKIGKTKGSIPHRRMSCKSCGHWFREKGVMRDNKGKPLLRVMVQ